MFNRFVLVSAIMALFVINSSVQAELLSIQMDGDFSDWENVTALASDPANDGGSSGIDFRQVWVGNDENYLYIKFDTTGEVQPDEGQSLRLYLDTDLNSSTGTYFNGIGAELVWSFGWRNGTFKVGSSTYDLNHSDIGLLVGPTVSNTQFEVAIARDAVPGGGVDLFSGEDVRFILKDSSSGGDVFPNSGHVTYSFSAGSFDIPSLSLDRDLPEHIRLASYNIEGDGLFDGGSRELALERIFQAIDADVFIINEVWDSSAAAVLSKVEQFLPSGTGQSWYAIKRDNGNVIVSRYPILQSWEVYPGHRITAALLDLGAGQSDDLLVIANHWRCCSADDLRQDEADATIAFLRDARTPGGVINLAENTPVLFGGDLNLVGWRQQLDTIISGDIQDESQFGNDSAPDWDGSDFAQPLTRQTDARASYTWRKDYSSYYPGMLDYILFTDSNLDLHNHFVLETRTMTTGSLSAAGLMAGDTESASDHAPRVADFTLGNALSSVPVLASANWAQLLSNKPNPFNPSTAIGFSLDRPTECSLAIFDMRGHEVRRFDTQDYQSGFHQVVWNGMGNDGRPVASGVYRTAMIFRAGGKEIRESNTMVLVK